MRGLVSGWKKAIGQPARQRIPGLEESKMRIDLKNDRGSSRSCASWDRIDFCFSGGPITSVVRLLVGAGVNAAR